MKILLMMSSIAMGGAERNIVSFVSHLKIAGVDVILCTLNKRRDGPLADAFARTGIERFDLDARRMTDIAAIRRFIALLRNEKIDLVHSQDQDTIIYGGLAHRFLNIPSVMTRHVLEEPVVSWRTAVRAKLVLWSARYGFDAVVAVSDAVRRHFSRQAGVPLDKIHTIYNGIELEKFKNEKSRDEIRADLGWDMDRPIAIFVSVLRPGKGFKVLFNAIPKIRKILPDFQVKLVGAGQLGEMLRSEAAFLGDAVEFLDERMDIPRLLGASDVLIQTSWSEALPTVLIEAGAAGIPVVATDVGGTSEIVQDGVSGYLIAPGDSDTLANRAVKILLSRELKERMGISARRHVLDEFSFEKQVKNTIKLYEKVLRGDV